MKNSKTLRPTVSPELQKRLQRVARKLDLCVEFVLENVLIEGGLKALEDVTPVTVYFPKDVLAWMKDITPNNNLFVIDAVFQALGIKEGSSEDSLRQRALLVLFGNTVRVNRLCA